MTYSFRNHSIDFTSTSPTLMAIVNVTPDSFHDGGKLYNKLDRLVINVRNMIEQGAKILDIGGESTRPGATPITAEEEMERVLPAVELIMEKFGSEVILSVDTIKPKTADAVLERGVDIINDVSGLSDEMLSVLQKHNCAGYVLTDPGYDIPSSMADTDINMLNRFKKKIELLKAAGIEQIIVDPGFGFHKTMADNYYLLNNLDFFTRLGLPILAGISHKSMIRKVLPEHADTTAATLVLDAIAVHKGSSVLRVHDIEPHSNVLRVLDALNKYN